MRGRCLRFARAGFLPFVDAAPTRGGTRRAALASRPPSAIPEHAASITNPSEAAPRFGKTSPFPPIPRGPADNHQRLTYGTFHKVQPTRARFAGSQAPAGPPGNQRRRAAAVRRRKVRQFETARALRSKYRSVRRRSGSSLQEFLPCTRFPPFRWTAPAAHRTATSLPGNRAPFAGSAAQKCAGAYRRRVEERRSGGTTVAEPVT